MWYNAHMKMNKALIALVIFNTVVSILSILFIFYEFFIYGPYFADKFNELGRQVYSIQQIK